MQVFHSDVDLNGAKTAIDILKRMVEVYGLEMQIQEVNATFLVDKVFPFSRELDMHGLPEQQFGIGIKPSRPDAEEAQGIFIVKPTLNELHVGLAFAINLTKYRADLRRHGIKGA